MKSSVFWDIMLCSPLKVNKYFEGKCCLHFQGKIISQARKQHEAGSKQSNHLAKILVHTGNRRAKQHKKSVQEVICSEMSVDPQQTTQCYIPEGKTLHNHYLRTSNPIYSFVVIFRKITVQALEAKTLNGNFLKTGFTDQTNFTFQLCKAFISIVIQLRSIRNEEVKVYAMSMHQFLALLRGSKFQ
jgi:hypothetical protein